MSFIICSINHTDTQILLGFGDVSNQLFLSDDAKPHHKCAGEEMTQTQTLNMLSLDN